MADLKTLETTQANTLAKARALVGAVFDLVQLLERGLENLDDTNPMTLAANMKPEEIAAKQSPLYKDLLARIDVAFKDFSSDSFDIIV